MEFLLEHRLVVDARSEAGERAGNYEWLDLGIPRIRCRWRGESGR
jgi:hypothetical protein